MKHWFDLSSLDY